MANTRESKRPTAALREAQKAFKEAGAKVAISEYERNQEAFRANRERLRAERLAREAAVTESAMATKKRLTGKARRGRRSGRSDA
jgi:aspartate aminotransferase-like enzyme